jgi:hypothetical protein
VEILLSLRKTPNKDAQLSTIWVMGRALELIDIDRGDFKHVPRPTPKMEGVGSWTQGAMSDAPVALLLHFAGSWAPRRRNPGHPRVPQSGAIQPGSWICLPFSTGTICLKKNCRQPVFGDCGGIRRELDSKIPSPAERSVDRGPAAPLGRRRDWTGLDWKVLWTGLLIAAEIYGHGRRGHKAACLLVPAREGEGASASTRTSEVAQCRSRAIAGMGLRYRG